MIKGRNIKAGKIAASQNGFTLVELVMVIVILGILAAVAIPKFMDLSGSAKVAEIKGFAAAMAGAASANYAGCKVSGNVAGANCTLITDCNNICVIMQGGVCPNDSSGSVTTPASVPVVSGATVTCTVAGTDATAVGSPSNQFLITAP